jgi:hypothetical protein
MEKQFNLPDKIEPAKRNSPRLAVVFGQSKVGKTTMLSKLDDCLIIDTEHGAELIPTMSVQIDSLADLRQVIVGLSKKERKYNYIAIDTLDRIVYWTEQAVSSANGVKDIGDIPYGAGYSQVRTSIMNLIDKLKTLTDHVILVAHRKKTIIGEDSITFDASSLDLSGKLKNFVCSDADIIAYLYRDKEQDNKLMLSFYTNNELDAGSRFPQLAGKTFQFNWNVMYPDADVVDIEAEIVE